MTITRCFIGGGYTEIELTETEMNLAHYSVELQHCRDRIREWCDRNGKQFDDDDLWYMAGQVVEMKTKDELFGGILDDIVEDVVFALEDERNEDHED